MDEESHGMKKELIVGIALLVLIVGAFLLIGQFGGNTAPVIDSLTEQVNSEGPVTVSIRYSDNEESGSDDSLAFHVKINTHTVSLDGYEIDKLAALKDSQGNVYTPSKWTENPGSGGHHRSGILYFDLTDETGNTIIDSQDTFFEITMKDVGNVAVRSFRWDI